MRHHRRPLQPTRGLPSPLARLLTRTVNVSVRRDWLAAVLQLSVAAGTIGLAIASYFQIRQANRAAAAMERTNQISVAVARSVMAPRFALPIPRIDSGTLSGDTATCWLRVQVQNVDTRPIRVVSLSCSTSSHRGPFAHLRELESDSIIAAGATSDFQRSVRVIVSRDTGTLLLSWLHVTTAVRAEGHTGTSYGEYVFMLATRGTSIDVQPMFYDQYTGTTSGFDVKLDPWCDQVPSWPWSNKAELKPKSPSRAQAGHK